MGYNIYPTLYIELCNNTVYILRWFKIAPGTKCWIGPHSFPSMSLTTRPLKRKACFSHLSDSVQPWALCNLCSSLTRLLTRWICDNYSWVRMATRGGGLIFTFYFRRISTLIHAHSHHGEKLMGVDVSNKLCSWADAVKYSSVTEEWAKNILQERVSRYLESHQESWLSMVSCGNAIVLCIMFLNDKISSWYL